MVASVVARVIDRAEARMQRPAGRRRAPSGWLGSTSLWRFGVGLALVGWTVVTLGDIARGGFYVDDWLVADRVDAMGFGDALVEEHREFGNKPLLAAILTVPHELFGQHPSLHHALAAIIVAGAAALFVAVLRQLRLPQRDAVAITILVLLAPWASAVRFWPTGTGNSVAVPLFFAGFLLALRGLRVGGSRGVAFHLTAVALYAASLLTYETATLVIACAWVGYVWLHGWGRAAHWRAAVDLAVVASVVAYGLATTTRDIVGLGTIADSAQNLVVGGGKLLIAAFVPVIPLTWIPSEVALVPWLLLAGAAGAAALGHLRTRGTRRLQSAQPAPLGVIVAAGAVLLLSWAIYVPANAYVPDGPGIENRVNVLAIYPLAVLVYYGVVWACRRFSRSSSVCAAVALTAIAAAYLTLSARDQRHWARASDLQRPVLAAVKEAKPSRGSLVLTFGHRGDVAAGIAVFSVSWDLYSAIRLTTRDRTLESYPVYEGARLRCTPGSLTIGRLPSPDSTEIDPRDNGSRLEYPYGTVTMVDVTTRRSFTPTTIAACARLLRTLRPGPFVGL